MKGGKLFGITAILVSLASFGAYAYYQYSLLLDYCYKIIGFKINKFKKDDINIDLILALKNQSNIAVNITKVYCDVYVQGVLLTKVVIEKSIKWKGIVKLPISISVNPQKLIKDQMAMAKIIEVAGFYALNQKDKINLSFDVEVKAGLGFIQPKIKTSISYNLKEFLETSPSTCEISKEELLSLQK